MKEAAGGKVAGCPTFQTQSIVLGFLGHHDFQSMAILVKYCYKTTCFRISWSS